MKVLPLIDRWLHRRPVIHRAFTDTWMGRIYHRLVQRT